MSYPPPFFSSTYWKSLFSNRWLRGILGKPVRIGVATAQGFNDDDCAAKASALTFYSLLSIVPVLAVALGIAKGFGFEKHLETNLTQNFWEQREVINRIIEFAYIMLQKTQGGLIAGIGLIVLFWSVLKLLSNIESSLNGIWKIRKARSIARKFSDYLAMMLFCPVFFFVSSSVSVFVITYLSDMSQSDILLQAINPLIMFFLHVFPIILSWFLFAAIYYIMPNTRVPIRYALLAGVLAGTTYQIVQWVYIQFQVGISSYGAIYGSFAALPLFLLWINTSWLIVLAGAEIAYHTENDQMVSSLARSPNQQQTDARVVGLLTMQQCVDAFLKGDPPPTVYCLAKHTAVPIILIRELLKRFIEAGLVVEVNWKDKGSGHYLPARNPEKITIKSVCDALDVMRHERYLIIGTNQVELYEKTLAEFDQLTSSSSINRSLEIPNKPQ